jgi:hypothetical protein
MSLDNGGEKKKTSVGIKEELSCFWLKMVRFVFNGNLKFKTFCESQI